MENHKAGVLRALGQFHDRVSKMSDKDYAEMHQTALYEAAPKKKKAWGAEPTEYHEQKALFAWMHEAHVYGSATANGAHLAGGQRGWAILKASGVKAGFPDVVIVGARDVREGHPMFGRVVFVEMKRKGLAGHARGGCSEEQVCCHELLRASGHVALVCYGWSDAVTKLTRLGYGVPGDGLRVAESLLQGEKDGEQSKT